MKFWIDIVNSPHVLFFKPIIDELRKQGHEVSITAREYAQTIGLLNEFRLSYEKIGAHAGANIWKKIFDVFARAAQLYSHAKDRKYDIALTFNSPSLAVAAKLLRIPSMVFMDYEYQPLNHLTFRLCDKVVTPSCFPDLHLRRFDALRKTVKYNGLKEQVYLTDSIPKENILESLGVNANMIVAVVRPPATMALYHHFENDLFYDIVVHLLKNNDNIQVIAFPRSREQEATLRAINMDTLIIPKKPINGRDLLCVTDFVISAGGTMNREAAVLGIPAYTVFKGDIGAVDRFLIEQGRIMEIKHRDDIEKIAIQKTERKSLLVNTDVFEEVVGIILDYVGNL